MSWAFLFLLAFGGDDPEKFTIEGNVVNAVTGEPLRHAAITMQGALSPEHNTSISADAGGHFIVTGLPAGNYSLFAQKQGFAHGMPVPVAAGHSRPDITIKLIPLGRIAGKVVDDAGDPILGANVQLFRSAIQGGRRIMQPAGNAVTNDLGEYHASSLVAGRYFVSVVTQPDPDGAAYARTFYGGGHDIRSAAPLELTAGGSERADVRMRPVHSFSVRGRVVNLPENMHPYLNIGRRGSVLAANESHATQVDAVTGQFEFRGITPGDWIVTAGCFDRGAQLFGTAEVVVSDADSEGLVVALGKAIELHGTVKADAANPALLTPRSVYLALRPATDALQPAQTAQFHDDGKFTASGLQPGEYVLAVRTAEPWYVKSALLNGQNILNAPFSISAGSADGTIEIALAAGGGEINGTVVDGASQTANAFVLLLGPGPERILRLDPLGKFRIGNLAPGSYTAYAFSEVQDLEYTNLDVMQRFSAASINVTEGAKQQVELKLNRTVY